ncbi:protein-disulfide isomerase [Williamsia limnetica]|uniref:Protein-disulfide isomerase n=1 Tax=Williamsia limnetica TaxID=882452 RepID=A0A318RHV0_WILLI|nr:thioredoxin domain-containing protein [Williamsia limnetica]PYE12938.1 protein-disulfide isomerase [Williamsia limnetica]
MSNKKKQSVPKVTTSKYQPRKQSSTMTYVLGGLAVVLIAAVVIGGIVWNNSRSNGEADTDVLATSSTFTVGSATAPHTIDMFEDFQCPACRNLEQSSGAAVTDAVNSGQLQVRYHMLTFLNKQSGSGTYSSRAAGAMKCVADSENQDVQLAFHSKLFQVQPQEGGQDHDNAALAGFAKDVGASDATQQCIADGTQVRAAEDSAEQSQTELANATGGQVGTPSVLQDGKQVAVTQGPQWVADLIGSNNS